jgi:hypothetical protein
MSMSDPGVSYAVADGIARITLNRPPVNALSLDTVRAIVAAMRRAGADHEARAVVLTSAVPRRFCAASTSPYCLANPASRSAKSCKRSTSICTTRNTISASRLLLRSEAPHAAAE